MEGLLPGLMGAAALGMGVTGATGLSGFGAIGATGAMGRFTGFAGTLGLRLEALPGFAMFTDA